MADININDKPKRTAEELIIKLQEEKGISFNLIDEEKAIEHLQLKNNYLRTASYRKNFDKYTKGANIGKYIRLDFSYLIELSTIDMYLRSLLLKMCIDLEHSLKIKFVSSIETNAQENGYEIVKEFFQAHPSVLSSIESKADSIFTGDLIKKYFSLCFVFDQNKDPITGYNKVYTKINEIDCPAWVLVELISFGDLVKLINFYNEKYSVRQISIPGNNILNPIRSLRNACAHNNCLLNNMKPNNTHPPIEITRYISSIPKIGKEERNKKLSCRPIFEIVCLLKTYREVVSTDIQQHGIAELSSFFNNRMYKHIDYFEENGVVRTSFDFLKKLLTF